ncbi:MAG: hypothetical protein AAF456_14135 [Planctomycetota bacterium]
MALTTKFETPAFLRDTDVAEFYDNWSNVIKDEIDAETTGQNGGAFYNPALTEVTVQAKKTLIWTGFPRRVISPGGTPPARGLRDDKPAAYKQADETDRRSAGHDQDEYFEWYVHRNSAGKITRVTFVTELRAYYKTLFDADPDAVLSIYRKHVSPDVELADLVNGSGAYDFFNRWNTTDGILHYTRSINSLEAAVGLAEQLDNPDPPTNNNFDADPPFGATTTAVDPRVDYDVHMLVRNGKYVTFADPVGIYIVDWNNTGITLPDGKPAPASWWKIKRGVSGMALRVEYQVPQSRDYVVGDLKLGGHPIRWGGQLAEQVTVGIPAVAGVKKGS